MGRNLITKPWDKPGRIFRKCNRRLVLVSSCSQTLEL